MTAHGTDPASVDEETLADICVMYTDGMIGNGAVLEVLGTLTAGHFNQMLPKGKAPYKLRDIIPQAYEYLNPPLSEQDKKAQASKQLLAFAMMSPGAPQVLLEAHNG